MSVFLKYFTAFTGSLFLLASASLFAASVEGTNQKLSFKNLPAEFEFIRIHGPEGHLFEINSSSFNSEEALLDGEYRFEVVGTLTVEPKVDRYKQSLNNGRDSKVQAKKQTLGTLETGYFRIQSAKVLTQKHIKE